MDNQEHIPLKTQHYHKAISSIIKLCESKNCLDYWQAINKIEKNAISAEEAKVIDLISKIVSFRLVSDSPNDPYKPMLTIDENRSSIPDDLTTSELEFLNNLVLEIEDDELRARIYDILWVTKYGNKAENAKAVIKSYLSSAENLLKDSWHECFIRLERALRIFTQIGLQNRNADKKIDAVKKINQYIRSESISNTSPYLVLKLMNLLFEVKLLDETYLGCIEKIAYTLDNNCDYEGAKFALQILIKFYNRQSNVAQSNQSKIRIAEIIAKNADTTLKNDNPSHAKFAYILQEAIEVLKDVPNQEQYRKQLYKKLTEAQLKIPNEMGSFPVSIQITEEETNRNKSLVHNVITKDVFTTLSNFAFIQRMSKNNITQIVKENNAQNPLHAHVKTTYHDNEGKQVASHNIDNSEEAAMYNVSNIHREYVAKYILKPALELIRLEFNIPLDYWMSFVTNHPFVPDDKVLNFALGLFHGFHGDFLSASCVLIPQIEDSIRYLLKNNGINTSFQAAGGNQEENSLGYLLKLPELKDIIGEDLIFDLRGLLVEKTGSNFRHRQGHGEVGGIEFFGSNGVYTYWAVIHLLFKAYLIPRPLD